MRSLFLTVLILLRTSCSSPSPALQTGTSPRAAALIPVRPPKADNPLRPLEVKVFALANRQRRLHGLHALEWTDTLAEQARLQSLNMMERFFFSHIDPLRGSLSARLNTAGIQWVQCGENIFREKGMSDPASEAVEGWMKSASHRKSLLDPVFTHSAVGIAISPDTEYFITQIFLRPNR